MTELFPTQPSQKVRRNVLEAELIECIVKRGEGKLAASGAWSSRQVSTRPFGRG